MIIRIPDETSSVVRRIDAGNSKKIEEMGKFDPLINPKIANEVESNADAVYGYSPKKGSPLDRFGVDWTNP